MIRSETILGRGQREILDLFKEKTSLKRREIEARLGLSRTTAWRRLRALREQGLIRQVGEAYKLTRQGRELLMGAEITAGDEPILDLLPTPEHRAVFQLILDAVIARYHLLDRYPSQWPGFILGGRTKSLKTLTARLVCWSLGLDDREHVLLLQRLAPGTIAGRWRQIEGGRWVFDVSPYFAKPLICFDEFDKASPDQRREALCYLQGESELVLEDRGFRARIIQRATPILTLNKQRPGELDVSDEFKRRCVLLDTDALPPDLPYDRSGRRLVGAAHERPPLSLDQLKPCWKELTEEDYDLIEQILLKALTPEGLNLSDVQSLAKLALGRTARIPHKRLAIALVCRDYLLTARTLGHVKPGAVEGLQAKIEEYMSELRNRGVEVKAEVEGKGGDGVSVVVPASQPVVAQHEAGQPQAEPSSLAEEIEFIRKRGDVVEWLSRTLQRLGRYAPTLEGFGILTQGDRDALTKLRDRARKLRPGDEDELQEIIEVGTKLIEGLNRKVAPIRDKLEVTQSQGRPMLVKAKPKPEEKPNFHGLVPITEGAERLREQLRAIPPPSDYKPYASYTPTPPSNYKPYVGYIPAPKERDAVIQDYETNYRRRNAWIEELLRKFGYRGE